MWKIFLAFVIFAGASLFLIFSAGDKVDMQGEAAGHNPTEVHAGAAAADTTATAPVPSTPAAAGK